MPAHHRLVAVVFDGMQPLDLVGPTSVLDAANHLGASPAYEVEIVSPDGAAVRAEGGVTIGVDGSLSDLAGGRRRFDTLLVVGGFGTRALIQDTVVLADLVTLAGRARRVVSVCTGALVLGAAGLLDGRRATTHWHSCDLLRRIAPEATIESDRLWVHDGDRWTSAGVAAGIDLFLALVEHDQGPEIAHEVACWLVVFAQRPGGQSQFSTQLRAAPARSEPVRELQRWLPDHLTDDLSVEALAARVGVSPRTLARRFRDELDMAPGAYVESVRVDAARSLLESTDLTVAAVAARVGLTSAETLHRAFRRRLRTTPHQYRTHFRRPA